MIFPNVTFYTSCSMKIEWKKNFIGSSDVDRLQGWLIFIRFFQQHLVSQIPSKKQDTRQSHMQTVVGSMTRRKAVQTFRERREPALSLILSALLSVSWVASRSLFRNVGAVLCTRSRADVVHARDENVSRRTCFLSTKRLFLFSAPFSASQPTSTFQ